jgi:hypothetical protein
VLGLGLIVGVGFAASDPVVTSFSLAGFAGCRRPHAPGGRRCATVELYSDAFQGHPACWTGLPGGGSGRLGRIRGVGRAFVTV